MLGCAFLVCAPQLRGSGPSDRMQAFISINSAEIKMVTSRRRGPGVMRCAQMRIRGNSRGPVTPISPWLKEQ